VVGEADLTGQFRVANDGTVDFPFAGRLFLLGKNSGDVQQIITEKLKDGYLKNPQVSVMVKEWNSRKVVVLGQVAKPGSVVYFPSMTIVDAIAAAGGFTAIADKNTVIVRRELKGHVETRTYRVADISEGKSPNVSVRPGDLLMVEERMF
jgi:polysaccharide export outer membrane protein